MKVNENILKLLTKIAESNDEYPRARLAAAVVYKNKIISIGINRNKTDPLQAKFGKNDDAIYLHAEIHAIKNALRELSVDDLAKCDLYICRVKRPSEKAKKYVWGLSRPCCGCSRAIAEFGIKNVIFTTDNNDYQVL